MKQLNKIVKSPVCKAELKVLECLWEHGPMCAKELALLLEAKTHWKKTTSYTVFKNCVQKGLIKRSEPKFMCEAIFTKEEVQLGEAMLLADKLFGGSSVRMALMIIQNNPVTTINAS